jgi:hypothetical protein
VQANRQGPCFKSNRGFNAGNAPGGFDLKAVGNGNMALTFICLFCAHDVFNNLMELIVDRQ